MWQILAIAGAGAVGAVARFWVATWVYGLLGRDFPWGTLAVNVAGSLLMGLVSVLLVERLALPPEARAALLVGFLGAFTTFSSFSLETLALVEQGEWVNAGLNILLSLVLCLFSCWAGILIARAL